MPGYVANVLQIFQHNTPPKMQHQPHPHIPPNYGSKTQYTTPLHDSKPLNKEGNRFIMKVTVTLLYYSREVDGIMLTELSFIAS